MALTVNPEQPGHQTNRSTLPSKSLESVRGWGRGVGAEREKRWGGGGGAESQTVRRTKTERKWGQTNRQTEGERDNTDKQSETDRQTERQRERDRQTDR